MVKGLGLGIIQKSLQIAAQPFTSCVIVDNYLIFVQPHFLHIKIRDINRMHYIKSLWILKEWMQRQCCYRVPPKCLWKLLLLTLNLINIFIVFPFYFSSWISLLVLLVYMNCSCTPSPLHFLRLSHLTLCILCVGGITTFFSKYRNQVMLLLQRAHSE